MIYKLNGNKTLFSIDRARIIDIAPNDVLEIDGMDDVRHVWTEQDAEFMENNPDDLLFLEIERQDNGQTSSRIVLQPIEVPEQPSGGSGG